MAVITLPFVFVNGTIAQAAQVNADFSAIATDYNGNITNANIAANAGIALSKLANLGIVAGCRLTATTGVPITNTDVTSTSTIYVTPYQGGMVPLYNGSQWSLYQLTELPITLTGLTTSTIYDVYITLSSGAPVAAPLQAWTGATPPTRTILNGFTVLAADNTQLLVGSFGAKSSTATQDSAASRYISNVFNAVPRYMYCSDTTGSWTYASATIRPANGSSASGVGTFFYVSSLGNTPVYATMNAVANSGVGGTATIGIGVNSTTAFTSSAALVAGGSVAAPLSTSYCGIPGLGLNYLQRLEQAAAGSNTYYGSTLGANQAQMVGMLLG